MMKRLAIPGIALLALGASMTAVNAAGPADIGSDEVRSGATGLALTSATRFVADPVVQDLPASAALEATAAPLSYAHAGEALIDAALIVEDIPGGEASWYGARFAGRPTASGERFNPDEYTAAHRTLPFGSRVRVTHAASGRSVIVRINDRGPFHGDRVIDLSRAAAEDLGIRHAGHGNVDLALLAS